MEFTKRDNVLLGGLYKPFADQIRHFLQVCWKEGHNAHLSQGFRTFAEQDRLFAGGYSRAKGGESLHNYGIAADIVFDNDPSPGIQNPYVGSWDACANIGARCGLVPGHYWKTFKDSPHYEANITSKVSDLRSAFIRLGHNGLWDFLDTHEKDAFKLPPSAGTIES